MAEQVQAVLDSMVAPLKDLMEREIFTPSEIQAIVKRRRESEYLLRRRVARKADFLRYIEAEELLESLRKLRSQQKQRDHRHSVQYREAEQQGDDDEDEEEETNMNKTNKGNPNGKQQEKHIGDIHILQLIHLLFARAIRKFRSDLSLHLLHVDVCKKHQSWTKLSRVYAEALQIFPRQEGLWIESASHEFFSGPRKSIRNARILLQRGIRTLGRTSSNLWIEYFSLEMHYAQTLRGRRQILLHGGNTTDKKKKTTKKKEGDESNDDDDNDDISPSGEGTNSMVEESNYTIAMIVYKNAIRTIPDSIEFRLRFLDTCRQFPDTQSLMDTIQDQVQQDFGSHTPEAWIARAVYEAEQTQPISKKKRMGNGDDDDDVTDEETKNTNGPNKKAKTKNSVVSVLEEGMEAIDTYEMKLHAFRFAMRYAFEQDEVGNRDAVKQSQNLAASIMKACDGQTVSSDLALEQCEYYLGQDDPEHAIKVLETFCSSESKGDTPSSLWIRWASLYDEKKDHTKAKQILKRGLNNTLIRKVDHMIILLQYFGCLLNEKESKNKTILQDTFQRILLLAPTAWEVYVSDVSQYSFGISCICEAYLKYLKLASEEEEDDDSGVRGSTKVVRSIYESILLRSTTIQVGDDNPNFGFLQAFIDEVLQLEDVISSTKMKKNNNKVLLCRIYDKAIGIFQGTPLEDHYRQCRNDGAIYSIN